MKEEDQPPEHIWLNAEALNQHFDDVMERYRSPNTSGSEPVPDPADFQQNELTKGLRRG